MGIPQSLDIGFDESIEKWVARIRMGAKVHVVEADSEAELNGKLMTRLEELRDSDLAKSREVK